MTQFKVGDLVRVVDTGQSYTTYSEWATRNGLKNYQEGFDHELLDQVIVEVVAVAPWGERDVHTILAGIQDTNGKQYIVGVIGLELVRSAKPALDFSKPIQTRDGRAVDIRFTDGTGSYPVVGYIEDSLSTWTKDGQYHEYGAYPENDLVNVPVGRTLYVMMLKGSVRSTEVQGLFESWLEVYKDEILATKIVTITEGEKHNG